MSIILEYKEHTARLQISEPSIQPLGTSLTTSLHLQPQDVVPVYLVIFAMVARLSALMLFGASAAIAGPILPRQNGLTASAPVAAAPVATTWNAGAVQNFPIHASCNVTQRVMLQKGLNEAMTIVSHARDHILRWGSSSAIYTKYFGDAPTGEPIGWYTKLADGDKADILFRCDDIDGNCGQSGTSCLEYNRN